MRKAVIVGAFALLGFQTQAQQTVQPESVVRFSIGGIGWSTVEGTLNEMSGTAIFKNEGAGSSFNICINAGTIFTDNSERDTHLNTEDFFNVSKYSQICFVSSKVQKEGSNYIAIGKLTIIGVSKEVSIPFTVSEKDGKTTLTGKLEVNRFDYGLAEESYSSTLMVDDIAEVEIVCVLKP